MDKLLTLELNISKFLRWGVIVSGVLILIGWLASFEVHSDPFINLKNYSELSLFLNLELAVMDGDWGVCLAYFGLFSLISLPIIRVFLTMFLFLKQKEFMLAGIAALVLIGLFISFTFGIEL